MTPPFIDFVRHLRAFPLVLSLIFVASLFIFFDVINWKQQLDHVRAALFASESIAIQVGPRGIRE